MIKLKHFFNSYDKNNLDLSSVFRLMESKTILALQRKYFNEQHTKKLSARKLALSTFKKMLIANRIKIEQAVFADFGKSAHEVFLTEYILLIKDIDQALRSVQKWSKAKSVRTNLVNWPAKSFVLAEPFGLCLVIGAWNYPIQLSLAPVISALAAGNTVVVKPSELAPNSAQCIAEIIAEYFDPTLLAVIQGGPEETGELLKERFDKIFFTGSPAVGRIVYEAAAKHLTPVTLELGGKSPAIITQHASIDMAVRRIIWAKFLNAGQTCIAPDFILIHESIYSKVLELMKNEIARNCYTLEQNNYVQIINERHLTRLAKLINDNHIAYGGQINYGNRTIAPTLITNVDLESALMQEEIFGPLLPLIPYSTFQEAIAIISNKEKPLSAYLFTENKIEKKEWLAQLSFGGGCINDAIMHITNPNLPFGGVGQSGMGSYHGKAGFDTFSHNKSIFKKPLFEVPLKYPPYTTKKMAWIKRILRFS